MLCRCITRSVKRERLGEGRLIDISEELGERERERARETARERERERERERQPTDFYQACGLAER